MFHYTFIHQKYKDIKWRATRKNNKIIKENRVDLFKTIRKIWYGNCPVQILIDKSSPRGNLRIYPSSKTRKCSTGYGIQEVIFSRYLLKHIKPLWGVKQFKKGWQKLSE